MQKSYWVDFYRLHTGHSEWDVLVNPKTDASPVRYLRLTHPTDILTCIDCYDRPEIRRLLDDDIAGRKSIIDRDLEDGTAPEIDSKG
ncbi:MAG: hypothetical protein ABIP88_15405 [Candidatus Binatia bacterium]